MITAKGLRGSWVTWSASAVHTNQSPVSFLNKLQYLFPGFCLLFTYLCPARASSLKNLVIFDDVVNQKDQILQREYFIRGRHMNCTVFYLTQRYYDVPKIVRDNSNLIILFKQPHRSLTLLFNELDAENADKFKMIAREAWNSRHGYVAINTALDDGENLTSDLFNN